MFLQDLYAVLKVYQVYQVYPYCFPRNKEYKPYKSGAPDQMPKLIISKCDRLYKRSLWKFASLEYLGVC